jgi:hypothetical protein
MVAVRVIVPAVWAIATWLSATKAMMVSASLVVFICFVSNLLFRF